MIVDQNKVSEIYEYSLDERESKVVDQCLRYCLHRMKDHPDSGIKKMMVKRDEVESLIDLFK